MKIDMGNNNKIILTAIVAVAIGLGVGYFIFTNHNHVEDMPGMDHDHGAGSSTETVEATEWICSMHPQIRQPEPGLCPICEMDLIPAGGSTTSDDPLVLQMTESAVKLANIQTTTVGLGMGVGDKSILLSGKVKADERLASSQVAHVPGRIEKLYVSYTGEQVRSGQKIATLYSPELITAQRELLEALKLTDLNPGLLEAARNKLRFWKIGEEAIEGIEEKGEIRETFHLYSSGSGVVTNRRVAVGDYVKKGEPLFDLMNLGKVWVLFDAYEENISQFSVGDRIEFSTPSVPGKTYHANITFIDPVIDPNTRVASLRTEVSNPKGQLKPEMFVNGRFIKKSSSKALLTVPKSAVMWTGKRSVVYVKVPDMEVPSFQFREVELGESLGNSYQVLNGLEAGEEVVTNGSFTIDAAAQLNNQASMMNKDVALKKVVDHAAPNFREETPEEFQMQLNELVNAYIDLKDALVATDEGAAAKFAGTVVEKLDGIDMSLLQGEAHQYWMEQLVSMESHGKKMNELTDIEEQRKQFGFFSEVLINVISAFGSSGEQLYIHYCPMAFNNEGADWLATEEAIRNPYFGDKMMNCGSVKRQLSPSQ